MVRTVISLLLCLSVASSFAAEQTVSRLLGNKVISEAIDTARKVSNTAGAVGLSIATTPDHAGDPTSIWVYVPTPNKFTADLKVTSADGRYVATSVLEFTAGVPGWSPLALPGEEAKKKLRDPLLKEYFGKGSQLIAYAASADKQDQGDPQVFLPIASFDASGKDPVTSVLVKSEGAQTVTIQGRAVADGTLGATRRCRKVSKIEPFYFDYYCETNLSELTRTIQVNRIRDNESLPPIQVKTRQ